MKRHEAPQWRKNILDTIFEEAGEAVIDGRNAAFQIGRTLSGALPPRPIRCIVTMSTKHEFL
jgi:hypothetical protein